MQQQRHVLPMELLLKDSTTPTTTPHQHLTDPIIDEMALDEFLTSYELHQQEQQQQQQFTHHHQPTYPPPLMQPRSRAIFSLDSSSTNQHHLTTLGGEDDVIRDKYYTLPPHHPQLTQHQPLPTCTPLHPSSPIIYPTVPAADSPSLLLKELTVDDFNSDVIYEPTPQQQLIKYQDPTHHHTSHHHERSNAQSFSFDFVYTSPSPQPQQQSMTHSSHHHHQQVHRQSSTCNNRNSFPSMRQQGTSGQKSLPRSSSCPPGIMKNTITSANSQKRRISAQKRKRTAVPKGELEFVMTNDQEIKQMIQKYHKKMDEKEQSQGLLPYGTPVENVTPKSLEVQKKKNRNATPYDNLLTTYKLK